MSGGPRSPDPAPSGTSIWAWVAVAFVLLGFVGVLVVSAYATSHDSNATVETTTSTTRAVYAVGRCVNVSASAAGPLATVVPCSAAVTGRILVVVDSPRPCSVGTAVALADSRTTLCLEPV